MKRSGVKVKGVSKRFGEVVANEDINLSFEPGEFTTLLGPSGSGKTTLLRIIAGLIKPDSGAIYFDDQEVTNIPPHRRDIGFVFQNIALFPHMKVFDNIAFGLKMNKTPKQKIKGKIQDVMDLLHISGLEDRYPRHLSGGQAQRVALARVLVTDPRILLLDEPLSSLDAKLVEEFRYEIRRLQRETGKTTIYVTHDQTTAFTISDIIALLDEGKIKQVGTPTEIYTNPKVPFTTEFIGSTNFFEGEVSKINMEKGITEVDCGPFPLRASQIKSAEEGQLVTVAVKADSIQVLKDETEEFENVIEGKVDAVVFAGEKSVMRVKKGDFIIQVHLYGTERYSYLETEGKRVTLGFDRAYVL